MSKDIPKEYHHYLDIQSHSILQGGGQHKLTPQSDFFLGLIAGQMFCNGSWQVVDYFTGKTGNSIFGF